jgi:hypothetical protein
MATKIITLTGTVSTTETQIGANQQPQSGLKWTLVEIAASFGVGTGKIVIKFDTEAYYTLYSSIHNTQGTKRERNSEVVALDVVNPHYIAVFGTADSGTPIFTVQLTVEEAPLT